MQIELNINFKNIVIMKKNLLILTLFVSVFMFSCKEKKENKPLEGKINGYAYVDLGLPSGVKWATCNVGAEFPELSGDYYAWGEISTKTEYTQNNSSTYDELMNDISGNVQYDVARAKWGETWRMPKSSEIQELINLCQIKIMDLNGHTVCKVTGLNDKYIYLPVSGYRENADLHKYGDFGYYWSSTPEGLSNAYFLQCGEILWHEGYYSRYRGFTVRPVSD